MFKNQSPMRPAEGFVLSGQKQIYIAIGPLHESFFCKHVLSEKRRANISFTRMEPILQRKTV